MATELVRADTEIAELRKALGNNLEPREVMQLESKFAGLVHTTKFNSEGIAKEKNARRKTHAEAEIVQIPETDGIVYVDGDRRVLRTGQHTYVNEVASKALFAHAEEAAVLSTKARARRRVPWLEINTHHTTGWMFGVNAQKGVKQEHAPHREHQVGKFSPSFAFEWKKRAAEIGDEYENIALEMLRLHRSGELRKLDGYVPPDALTKFWMQRYTYFGEQRKHASIMNSHRERAVDAAATEMGVHINVYRQYRRLLRREGQETADDFVERNRHWQPPIRSNRKVIEQRLKSKETTKTAKKAEHESAVLQWLANGKTLERSKNPITMRERNTYWELADFTHWAKALRDGRSVKLTGIKYRQEDRDVRNPILSPLPVMKEHQHFTIVEGWGEHEDSATTLGDVVVEGSPKSEATKVAKELIKARLNALGLQNLPAEQQQKLMALKGLLLKAGNAERKEIKKHVPTATAILSSELSDAVQHVGKGDSRRLVQLMALGMTAAEALHVLTSNTKCEFVRERVVDEAITAADNRRGIYMDRSEVVKTLDEVEAGKMLKRKLKSDLEKIDSKIQPSKRVKALLTKG